MKNRSLEEELIYELSNQEFIDELEQYEDYNHWMINDARSKSDSKLPIKENA